MKKDATNTPSSKQGNIKGQTSPKVISKEENKDSFKGDDHYTVENEEDDFIEPKGPKKEDMKKNILFLDDDDDDEY